MFGFFKRCSKTIVISHRIRFVHLKKVPNQEERLRQIEQKRKKSVFDALISALGNQKCLSVSEWKLFCKDAQLKRIPCTNIDIFTAIKMLDKSKDPICNAENFIKAFDIEQNVVVNCLFIDLLTAKAAYSSLDKSEEEELLKLCNTLIENGMNILPEVNQTVVNGLCATNEWKRAVDFPQISKLPRTLNILIRKAMRETEIDIVWKLIEMLVKFDAGQLSAKTISQFWIFCTKKNIDTHKNIERMLHLLANHKRMINESPAETLCNILNQTNISNKLVQINYSGICPNCSKSLETTVLTKNEFNAVQTNFMKNVVQGDNIYYKTTPEEWKTFCKLIDQQGPFDVVMDGLNIAYGSNFGSDSINGLKGKRSKPNVHLLIEAVKQFVGNGKRVLVIGRKHMKQWPGLHEISSIASIFLVDNISKDDIFLLYGAMKSGPDAYILSNDFMRQHKYAIGRKNESLFKKWQQQNTYAFTSNHNVIKPFQTMKFKLHCHQHDGQWHVPFISDEERETFNWYALPKNWICFRL